jgi:RNA polymerase sigma factor (sigma-70 family)
MSGDPSDRSDSLTQGAVDENELLVRAIVDGNRDAERTFVARYLRPVRAMLLARSRNPDLTADLLQDAMIDAICALRRGQLRDPASLTPFVVGIARNLINNHYRAAARHPELLELPDDLPDLSAATDHVLEQEREDLAMRAIASLDPLDKAILQMTLVNGFKPGVIAQRLRLNPNVVRQRKLRATRQVIDLVRGLSQKDAFDHFNTGTGS